MPVPPPNTNSADSGAVIRELEATTGDRCVRVVDRNGWQVPEDQSTVLDGEKVFDFQAYLRLQRIAKELETLMSLPAGWDTYAAPPIDRSIIEYAERVYARAATLTSRLPSVVPTVLGGIQFEWHSAKADIEIEVIGRGEVDILARARNTDRRVEAEGVTEEDPRLAEAIRLLV